MRQLLNTLFITSEDIYLSVEGRMSWPIEAAKQWRGTRSTRCLASYPFLMPELLRP